MGRATICTILSSVSSESLFRSEAWASLSRLGAGQYALSLVTDPESSQATSLVFIISTVRFTHPEIHPIQQTLLHHIHL